MRDRYVLLAAEPEGKLSYHAGYTQLMHHTHAVARGNAKAIIRAACEASCGVLLIDLEDVPVVRSRARDAAKTQA